ncbi:MAG: NfeD family protein [Bryobacteraceae bacterium]|nr:NfeD family protein [Bryobacteraceae bacterium]
MIGWSNFYLFCFVFGFLFSLVSVFLAHVPGGHDWHVHPHGGGGHGPATGQGHGHSSHAVSPWNPGTAAAFLAWFGGTGFLATRLYSMWVYTTLALSLMAGIAGAAAVFWFLTRVLMREKEDLDPADYDMIGVFGTVSSTIRANGTGEILFSQAGSRHAVPARSEGAVSIPGGTEVVVTRYENGVAYVRRWDELTGAEDADVPTVSGH